MEKDIALSKEYQNLTPDKLPHLIDTLRTKMKDAANALDFEEAAALRDEIKALEEFHLRVG